MLVAVADNVVRLIRLWNRTKVEGAVPIPSLSASACNPQPAMYTATPSYVYCSAIPSYVYCSAIPSYVYCNPQLCILQPPAV